MTALLQTLFGGFNQGLIWGLFALGVYISFRILDFPDLTVEGSITLGASIMTVFIVHTEISLILACIIASFVGAIAGFITGLLNTKLKIPPILSGILVMIGLYSINIRIMQGPNLSILRLGSLITFFTNRGVEYNLATFIVGIIFVTVTVGVLYWFFGTEIGCAIRATGDNENMCRAQGINTDNTKIIALMISNALVALSGALIAQQQSYSNVTMGSGSIVIGLASVVIGEAFTGQKFPFWLKLSFIVLGSVVYRLIISLVIYFNFMDPSDLKLLTAIIVVIALSVPNLKKSNFFVNLNKRLSIKGKKNVSN